MRKHKHVAACVFFLFLTEAYKLENIKYPQVHVLKSIIKNPQMDVEVDLGLPGVAG